MTVIGKITETEFKYLGQSDPMVAHMIVSTTLCTTVQQYVSGLCTVDPPYVASERPSVAGYLDTCLV